MGKEDKQVVYTLRVDRDKWALFSAVAALKGVTVSDALRDMVDGYIRDNGSMLSQAAQAAKEVRSEGA